jgi:hypothetical protein
MVNIDSVSLAETLDAVHESFFYSNNIPESDRIQTARWIASRVGIPGCYAGMAAPAKNDFSNGIRTFTGEWVRSKAGISHVLGEEACRVLLQLNISEPLVKEALHRATEGMLQRLIANETTGEVQGLYCCGTCSVAYWRHILAGGLDKNKARLAAGIQTLKSLRTGDGRWRRFPFAYTLLALSEINSSPAIEEIQYAAPVMERYLKRCIIGDKYAGRKQTLYKLILAKC